MPQRKRQPETNANSSPHKQKNEFCVHGHKISEVGRTTSGRCRQCLRDSTKEDYVKPIRKRSQREERYAKALEANDGLDACALCGAEYSTYGDNPRRLHVDHDHETEKIRGLLCNTCNLGLGAFKDSIELMLEAINYLHERGDKPWP